MYISLTGIYATIGQQVDKVIMYDDAGNESGRMFGDGQVNLYRNEWDVQIKGRIAEVYPR